MNKKYIIIGAVILVVLGLIAGVMVGDNVSQPLGAANRLPHGYWDTADGYYVDGTAVINGSGAFVGTLSGTISSTNAASVGEFTEGGGIITISTSSATYTMTAAELASGNIISIAIATTSNEPALALTLPATSTWTSIIPNAGDSRDWWIQNLHTGAATTTTITTNTGIDLQGLGANDDVINGGVFGQLSCFRQASTDVVCFVKETVSAE